MWQQQVMAYFNVLPRDWSRKTQENYKQVQVEHPVSGTEFESVNYAIRNRFQTFVSKPDTWGLSSFPPGRYKESIFS
jgi:hypothetical protein